MNDATTYELRERKIKMAKRGRPRKNNVTKIKKEIFDKQNKSLQTTKGLAERLKNMVDAVEHEVQRLESLI